MQVHVNHGLAINNYNNNKLMESLNLLVDIEKTNKRYIYFYGQKYTYPMFKLMLKYMSKGIFMYPETLSKTSVEGEYETVEVKGWVLTKSIKLVTSLEDKHFLKFVDDKKDLIFIANHSHRINPNKVNEIVYFNNFSDVKINKVVDRLNELLNIADTGNKDEVIDEFANSIQTMFVEVVKATCDSCKVIGNKLRKVTYSYNVTEGDKTVTKTKSAHICTSCYKEKGPKPIVKENVDIGRNDKCMCGSGKKYKNCCG